MLHVRHGLPHSYVSHRRAPTHANRITTWHSRTQRCMMPAPCAVYSLCAVASCAMYCMADRTTLIGSAHHARAACMCTVLTASAMVHRGVRVRLRGEASHSNMSRAALGDEQCACNWLGTSSGQCTALPRPEPPGTAARTPTALASGSAHIDDRAYLYAVVSLSTVLRLDGDCVSVKVQRMCVCGLRAAAAARAHRMAAWPVVCLLIVCAAVGEFERVLTSTSVMLSCTPICSVGMRTWGRAANN